MADIFISYTREDRPRIERIAKALEDQDWSVWWDPQIPPGKTFSGIIKAALDAAKCVVVMWSRHSIDSEWVFEEANMGKRRGILVPAKIDPVEPPLGFGLIQAADLTDWDGDTRHAEFQGILTAISDIVGRQPESVESSDPRAGSRAGSEPKLTHTKVSEPKKRSNFLNFRRLAGLAVLLTAGVLWLIFQQPKIEVQEEIFTPKGEEEASVTPKVSIRLRSEPRTVTSEEAHKTFGLDENGRPINYIQNHIKDRGKVVFDRATGLMWQKSGSQNSLTYEKAQEYIEQLNREGFAGHSDWRLPTIPELMSLLIPQKQPNGLYTDPIFDTRQRWCWSADKRSSGSAWLVSFDDGDVGWLNQNIKHHVRAVRS